METIQVRIGVISGCHLLQLQPNTGTSILTAQHIYILIVGKGTYRWNGMDRD